jgi:hypothetical protein
LKRVNRAKDKEVINCRNVQEADLEQRFGE